MGDNMDFMWQMNATELAHVPPLREKETPMGSSEAAVFAPDI